MKRIAGFATFLLLGGCGGGNEGGLTADENAELNNAANMLDAAPEALDEVDEAELDTGEANGVGEQEAK